MFHGHILQHHCDPDIIRVRLHTHTSPFILSPMWKCFDSVHTKSIVTHPLVCAYISFELTDRAKVTKELTVTMVALTFTHAASLCHAICPSRSVGNQGGHPRNRRLAHTKYSAVRICTTTRRASCDTAHTRVFLVRSASSCRCCVGPV